MKTKSLIALSILCLALGACATTDTAADDPNVAKAADHANQSTPAARADYVAYSSLTPNTEQKTVTTTTTEPVWTASVENPDATLTQSSTASSTMASGSTTVDSSATVTDTTIADNTASVSGSTTTTTRTTTTSSSPSTMASSSSVDDDDDDTTTSTTTTETRKRLRKD